MFILASSSKARSEILKKIGFKNYNIEAPSIEEKQGKNEDPRRMAKRLSQEKGKKVALQYPNIPILSADTVVFTGKKLIDKALSHEDVKHAISYLSGRSHRVLTAICLTLGETQRVKISETKVKFRRIEKKEIEYFASLEEGIGKSGGYTLNGYAESFILNIQGCISSVMGLPSFHTINLLKSVNIERGEDDRT